MPIAMTAGSPPGAAQNQGEFFVAQVVAHVTDTVVRVWDLKTRRSFNAYGFNSAEWPIGQIVRCRLSDDGRVVEEMVSADYSTQQDFKSLRLIP